MSNYFIRLNSLITIKTPISLFNSPRIMVLQTGTLFLLHVFVVFCSTSLLVSRKCLFYLFHTWSIRVNIFIRNNYYFIENVFLIASCSTGDERQWSNRVVKCLNKNCFYFGDNNKSVLLYWTTIKYDLNLWALYIICLVLTKIFRCAL